VINTLLVPFFDIINCHHEENMNVEALDHIFLSNVEALYRSDIRLAKGSHI